MRILGVDPGISATGYGIIEVKDRRIITLGFGAVRNKDKSAGLAERLQNIHEGILRVIDEYQPQECGIEEVFYHENVRTAIVMGHARGVAMVAAKQRGLEVFEYAAREIKMSTAGSGAASKQQVQAMVKNLLRLTELPRPQDAADALAVALCHYHRLKFQRLTTRSGRRK